MMQENCYKRLTSRGFSVECAALKRVVSSAGRASPLQGEGHRFDPCTTHHFLPYLSLLGSTFKSYGPVVQLVRMPACHAGGRGFESRPVRHLSNAKIYLSSPKNSKCPRTQGFDKLRKQFGRSAAPSAPKG